MKIIKASIAIGASFLFLAGCVADTASPAEAEHAASSAQALEMTTFPSSLEDEHMNWHMHAGDPSMGGRRYLAGQPGSGSEFFDFHHTFIQQALAWYATTTFSPSLVTPWTQIPAVLKDARYGWTASLAAAEQ